VGGGEILGLGTNEHVHDLAPQADVFDLDGATVLPGFIESHSHLIGLGLTRARSAIFYNMDLAPIGSREDMLDAVADEVRQRPNGEWVTGRGFAYDRWPEKRLLTADELDYVSPDHPVALNSLGGHIMMTNNLGLRQAGINKEFIAPDNGTVEKDAGTGQPTGILHDAGMFSVVNAIPTPTESELLEAARSAVDLLVRLGFTQAHHIRNILPGGYGPEQLRPFVRLHDQGELPLRLRFLTEAYTSIGKVGDYTYIDALRRLGQTAGFGGRIKYGSIKVVSDGWLDARSGAQYEEYEDEPSKGYMYRPPEDYKSLISRAHSANLQMVVHCDGLRSLDVILDAYEAAQEETPREDPRHRLEHVSIVTDAQIERIAKLGLMVCNVPTYRNNPWYKDMIRRAYGDRSRLCLRYKSLQEAGVVVFGGSDCHPGLDEWLSPIGQIYLDSVEGPLDPAEKLSREDAVAMFTTRAAYGTFEESTKGTIEIGKYADLTVLTGNPLTVPDDDLMGISVLLTVVDGDVVYDGRHSAVRPDSGATSKVI